MVKDFIELNKKMIIFNKSDKILNLTYQNISFILHPNYNVSLYETTDFINNIYVNEFKTMMYIPSGYNVFINNDSYKFRNICIKFNLFQESKNENENKINKYYIIIIIFIILIIISLIYFYLLKK